MHLENKDSLKPRGVSHQTDSKWSAECEYRPGVKRVKCDKWNSPHEAGIHESPWKDGMSSVSKLC